MRDSVNPAPPLQSPSKILPDPSLLFGAATDVLNLA
jgi:hypothetical protein